MTGQNGKKSIYLFLTGSESKKPNLPFLLDDNMLPITAANAWIREVAGNGATVSPHTHRTYVYALFDFFSYLANRRVDWRKINNDIIIQYRDVQDENPSPHTKRLLNRRTINARIVVVERFYAYATQNGFIEKNPVTYKTVRSVRPIDSDMLVHLGRDSHREAPATLYERLPKPRLKWLPHDKVMEWVNSSEKWRDKLLARLLYNTGMRREEIVKLKIWELPARHSVDNRNPEISFEITGKGRRQRHIHLTQRDFFDLHDYIKIVRGPLVQSAKLKHDFIFVGRDGQPFRPGYVNQIFKRISESCGITITPHMLRHSFAIRSLQNWNKLGLRQPEKLLQIRLGHASVVTTQIYIHMTDEMLASEAHENASLIEGIISGGENEA